MSAGWNGNSAWDGVRRSVARRATDLPGAAGAILTLCALSCGGEVGNSAAPAAEGVGGSTAAPADTGNSTAGGNTSPPEGSACDRACDPDLDTTPWATVAAISAAMSHTCAIDQGSALYCWGSNMTGQLGDGSERDRDRPVRVTESTSWMAVSAGDGHTCGIDTERSLYCWGNNDSGQLGIGDDSTQQPQPVRVGTDTDWRHVSAGYSHTCALKGEGSLYCWGDNSAGQLGGVEELAVATPTQVGSDRWTEIHAGAQISCGIKQEGSLFCWGYNLVGQLGIGTLENQPVPTQVGTDDDWSTVAVSSLHTCAIKDSGTLFCWGDGRHQQLGAIDSDDTTRPSQVGSDSDWLDAGVGADHSCALKRDGSLYCWGRAGWGGTPGAEGNPLPVRVGDASSWAAFSMGFAHTCAIDTAGTPWCWGWENAMELGDGPVVIGDELGDGHVLASGESFSTAVRQDGSLWVWGRLFATGEDPGTTEEIGVPTELGQGSTWVGVSAGGANVASVDNSGRLVLWTTNGIQSEAAGFRVAAVGDSMACGISESGALSCWSGEYGVFDLTAPPTFPIDEETNWSSLAVDHGRGCAIKDDGTLYCWGTDVYEEALGRAGNTPTTPEQRVGDDTDWSSVSPGGTHTCAIKTDGSLYCWGAAGSALGHEHVGGVPARVGEDSDWAKVSAGFVHTCALKQDQTLYCWGRGTASGYTSNVGRSARVRIGIASNWADVAAGTYHTCAAKTHGAVLCWGSSYDGLGEQATPRPVLAPLGTAEPETVQ